MLTISASLGIDGLFSAGEGKKVKQSGVSETSRLAGDCDVLSKDAAKGFYENFLIPRLVASVGNITGGKGAVSTASTVSALKDLVKKFLLAEVGKGQ